MDYEIPDSTKDPTERLISIVKKARGDHYLSGPMAKSYLDEQLLKKEKIKLEWAEYKFPEYPQLNGEFTHFVSVLDLIFNMGTDIKNFLKLPEAPYEPERKWGT